MEDRNFVSALPDSIVQPNNGLSDSQPTQDTNTHTNAVSRAKKTSSRISLSTCLAVILALSALQLWLLKQDPSTYVWLQNARHSLYVDKPSPPPDYSELVLRDPQIGSRINLIGALPRLQKEAIPNEPKLVVFVGECSSCVNVDLKMYYQWARAHGLALIVLTTGTTKEATTYLEQIHVPIIMIPNVEQKTLLILNASWKPRFYLFSRDWDLVWIQKGNPVAYGLLDDSTFQNAVGSLKSEDK